MPNPTRGHTYYLARADRVLGFRSSDQALAEALRAVWHARPELGGRPAGEAAIHEGVSTWMDDKGAVQTRVVLFDPATDGYTVLPIESAEVAEAMVLADRSA